MTSKLTLSVLAIAFVLVAPQAFAQGAPTQLVPSQTAKQDKRAATPQQQTTKQQQTAEPKAGPSRADKKPATAKPAATTAAQQPAGNPQTAKKDVPRIESKPLGRVSVDNQGSTFGFSSETKMKMYETPDGQRIRGMDHQITTNRQPSYFGLSLSVPTTSTSSGDAAPGLFPLPLPPRP